MSTLPVSFRGPSDPESSREGWLPAALRTLVHAITAAVFAYPLTVGEAVVAAAVLAGAGALAGRRLATSPLRLAVVLALSLIALFAGQAARYLIVGTDLGVQSLGPAGALRWGEAAQLGGAAFALAFALRAMSARRPALAVLELGWIGTAFAALVIAHRNGAIHRPYDIADPFLEQGLDPTVALLAVGAGGALVAGLLLVSERHPVRWLFHAGALAAALLLLVSFTAIAGLPTPPIEEDSLGLRGEEESDEEEEEGGEPEDELEFRDNIDQSQQNYPVAVVLFHDDYSPPSGVFYFRQGAFSQFNGVRLVAATRDGADLDIAGRFPTEPRRIDPRPPTPWARRKVETTVALLTEHNRPFGLPSVLEVRPSENPDVRRFKRVYRVWSAAEDVDYGLLVGTPLGDSEWSSELEDHYTQGPDDPRYRALAERIVEETLPEGIREDPFAQALAIQRWLSMEGTYSLRSDHASAADPTASFLFGDLVGYCVHFAHASTFLMRSLGLPARVATGYAVDESVRRGGSAVLINGQTSHAWPELYVQGVGWLVMDVSPAQALSGAPTPPDPDLQRLLAELARGERPLPIDGAEPPKLEEIAAGTIWSVGGTALSLALLLFGFLSGAKAWRATIFRFAPEGQRPRLEYRWALDRLSEVSSVRLPGESPEMFARRLTDLVPSFATLTTRHLRATFGAGPGAAEPDRLRRFSEELGRHVPLHRRLGGWLTPWSWLRSR